ncbi:hypothetical protein R1sor_004182 [Riccia sorocarpa]|uniref:Uncharacterized protein n=1 Tax=Riccia sorocarpa TaxID=122646 RepID=A0ABD3H3T1_9MARC
MSSYLEFVPDCGDHTGDLSTTTSNIPLFSSLRDQSAFIATMGREGAIDSTYFQQHGNGKFSHGRTHTRGCRRFVLESTSVKSMDLGYLRLEFRYGKRWMVGTPFQMENPWPIQALENETLQNGFWPQTNQGTGYKPTGLPQDATHNGRDDTVVVLDVLERELQDENNLMLEAYVGDPADRPKRAFIPLEDITEGKFVVLRLDDDFEKEVPRVVWLGRAIGAVVRETSDKRHGQFLIEWWRPRHRKSTNATNQERYTDILVGQKDWEKDPGYFTPEWINATAAIYSWKYRSKGGVPQSARLNPLAKATIEAYFQMLDLVE